MNRMIAEAMMKALVVILSVFAGLGAGVFAARQMPTLPEGTLHIGAFVGAFCVTFLISLAVGVHWIERRRGL